MKYIRKFIQDPEQGIRDQINWFGSASFMWLVFGAFAIGMAILILLNPI